MTKKFLRRNRDNNSTTRQPMASHGNEHVPTHLIDLQQVVKKYHTPAGDFTALHNVDLQIKAGEFVAIVGKSGSGKSTLINMMTGIDRPTSGSIYIHNQALNEMSEGVMAEWRGRTTGVIFQFFQLLPILSCLENVMLPMDFVGMYTRQERKERALDLLQQVDMVEHATKLPSELSGGQQQRIAIARSLANDPPVLVADEPTGNLDSKTADSVFQLFTKLVGQNKTVVMVTHDDGLANRATRKITIAEGEIIADTLNTAP